MARDSTGIKWEVASVGHPFLLDGVVMVPVQWRPSAFRALNKLIKLEDVESFKSTAEGNIKVYWRPTIEPAANLSHIVDKELRMRIEKLTGEPTKVSSSVQKRRRITPAPKSFDATVVVQKPSADPLLPAKTLKSAVENKRD